MDSDVEQQLVNRMTDLRGALPTTRMLTICRFCMLGPPMVEEPLYEHCACPSSSHLTCVLQFARNVQSSICPICRTPFLGVRLRRTHGDCCSWFRDDPTVRFMFLKVFISLVALYLLTLLGHLQRASAHNRISPFFRYLLKYCVYFFLYVSCVATLVSVVIISDRFFSWRRHHQRIELYVEGQPFDAPNSRSNVESFSGPSPPALPSSASSSPAATVLSTAAAPATGQSVSTAMQI